MWPREHGAYAQLILPLLTAMAIGRARWAAIALGLAVIAVFLAHEPLLVLMGQRGVRASREQARIARRWLLLYGIAALVCAGGGVAWSPDVARHALLVPAVPGAAFFALILARRERTSAGEMLSAVTLSSIALPVALAASASPTAAWTCAAVFASGYSSATLSVRAVIARPRHSHGDVLRLTAALVAIGAVTLLYSLSRYGIVADVGWRAAAVPCFLSVALGAISASPRYLRYIGWTLMLAFSVSGVLLIRGLR
jgi:hypothetical protein